MKTGLDSVEGYEAAKRMSLRGRRRKDYAGASEIWRMMAESAGSGETFPYVELAKHYEHRLKDFAKAIDFVNEAMAILEAGYPGISPLQVSKERKELLHRLSRLERRLEKKLSNRFENSSLYS